MYVVPVAGVRALISFLEIAGNFSLPLRPVLVVWCLCLAVVAIGLAKRAHDCGRSGACSLMLFVPVVGWLGLIWLCLQEGTPGPNAAGRAPLEFADSRW